MRAADTAHTEQKKKNTHDKARKFRRRQRQGQRDTGSHVCTSHRDNDDSVLANTASAIATTTIAPPVSLPWPRSLSLLVSLSHLRISSRRQQVLDLHSPGLRRRRHNPFPSLGDRPRRPRLHSRHGSHLLFAAAVRAAVGTAAAAAAGSERPRRNRGRGGRWGGDAARRGEQGRARRGRC